MYPTVGAPASAASGIGGLVGAVLTGGIVVLLFFLLLLILIMWVYYRLIRAAVRDGILDAAKKTGSDGGGTPMVNGYPPHQDATPLTPHYGYRGPNG
jgi:hypothetical protein